LVRKKGKEGRRLTNLTKKNGVKERIYVSSFLKLKTTRGVRGEAVHRDTIRRRQAYQEGTTKEGEFAV